MTKKIERRIKSILRFAAIVPLLAVILFCFSSCFVFLAPDARPGESGTSGGGTPPDLGGDYSGAGDKLADLSKGLSPLFFPSGNWSNGGMFDCVWTPENVAYDRASASVKLSITEKNGVKYAGEYRSRGFCGFGYYSVCMKAVKKSGVVSSLFTYTGRSEGNPWDEIDIEFLGKDTTEVQFNYFTDGVGEHEHIHSLGFDASEDFHEYGFKWERDKITWYVDGKPVYRATEDIPQTPGRIMINAWPGREEDVKDWSGVFDGVFPVTPAEYKWIGYKAL